MDKKNMDVISLPFEVEDNKIDGKFRFAIAAIKRARELSRGDLPRIISKSTKITTLAVEELLSGSLRVLTGDAAAKAAKEEKLTYEAMKDEASQKESMPESKLEIEKEIESYLRAKEKAHD